MKRSKARSTRRGLTPHAGFTIVELVIAILIGSILTTIGLSSFNNAQGAYAVRSARTTYASMHARARAQAVEMGDDVLLNVDATGDSVWIEHDGAVLETIDFSDEMGIDLRSTPTGRPQQFALCFTARGYAESAGSCLNQNLRVEFWQGADSTSVFVLALGQLVGM